MRVRRTGRTVAGMLPALRLPLATLAVLLVSAPAAQAAKGLSVPIPAEGQVAVAVAGGAKGVKVKSAPAGVTVAGGVKKGRLAVAVVRPRGVAASGKVVFTLRGKAKGVKTFGAALDGGKAGAAVQGPRRAARQAAEGHRRHEGAEPGPGRQAVRQAPRPPTRPPSCSGSGWAPADPAGHAGASSAGSGSPARRRGTRGRPRRRPRRRRPRRRPAGALRQRPSTTTATARPTGRTRAARTPATRAKTARCPSPPRVRRAPASGWSRTRPSSASASTAPAASSIRSRSPSRPASLSCTANNGFECDVFDPIADASVGMRGPRGRPWST